MPSPGSSARHDPALRRAGDSPNQAKESMGRGDAHRPKGGPGQGMKGGAQAVLEKEVSARPGGSCPRIMRIDAAGESTDPDGKPANRMRRIRRRILSIFLILLNGSCPSSFAVFVSSVHIAQPSCPAAISSPPHPCPSASRSTCLSSCPAAFCVAGTSRIEPQSVLPIVR